MPAMKKRKADGPVVVNVDTSAPRRSYKKKGTYARRASSNWKKFSKLKPWADFGAMRYPRGTVEGISRFGETYADATPEQRMERAAVGWRGRGLYDGSGAYNPAKNFRRWATGAVANVGRGVGKSLNQSLVTGLDTAGAIGNAYMSQLAPMGQGMYTGSGLYSSNSLVTGMNSRPSVQFDSDNDESQSLIITHKEYVSDVFGPDSSAFTIQTFSLQPGLSQVFPFLAQFAQNFDEYEMIQMVWEFHSTVDSNATTNTSGNTGTIIMATNYKADSPAFSNKDEMIQYHGGVSGRLTETLVHGVECDPSKVSGNSGKYVRTAPVPLSDIKTYDIGLFNLAFQNTPPTFLNQQVGELWVYYKVKLAKPKLYSALGNTITQARYLTSSQTTLTTQMGKLLLKAASNNINLQVQSSVVSLNNAFQVTRVNSKTVFTATSQSAAGVSITFPATTSGVFELRLFTECIGAVAVTSSAGDRVQLIGKTVGSVMTQNNIKPWFDMYAYNDGANSIAPWWFNHSIQTTQSCSTLIVRIKVETVTNGVDNTIVLYPFGSSPTLVNDNFATQSLECIEIGSAFAQSGTIQAPQWIDVTGLNVSVTQA